jgi:hypothetical protein
MKTARALVALVMGAAATAAAQAQAPPTVRIKTAGTSSIEGRYGPVQPEDLADIASNGSFYQQHNVVVHGTLDVLVESRFFSVRDGAARVLLIPFSSSDFVDLARLVGSEVDVTGIVRTLPASQKTVPCAATGGSALESKCNDPLLPELPNAQPIWPATSITIVTMSDRGTGRSARGGGPASLADTGVVAAAAAGKPVLASGQFRGANLCRDLPTTTRREPADWVLLTSEGPVWVVAHGPAGDGFHLDPADRGDTARWLQVKGKVEIVGGVRYLKASKVSLVPRPEEVSAAACPP